MEIRLPADEFVNKILKFCLTLVLSSSINKRTIRLQHSVANTLKPVRTRFENSGG
jgi:hypothetical protein